MTRWYADSAWLGGAALEDGVLIDVDGARITAVRSSAERPSDAMHLPGIVVPGFANVHSHAFHRALRGRTETPGDFWSWRARMYAVAGALDPQTYGALARATYAEMVLAGVTAVGEFHYLHHQHDGRPYDDPNVMAQVLVEAAGAAGLRLTLLDTCYLAAGVDGAPPQGVQRRFSDGDAERWVERVSALPQRLAGSAHVRLGVAVHSVRAVPRDALAVVAGVARRHQAPLHVHLSEQRAENEECLARTGRTPAALLEEMGVLGERTTAVHATHVSDGDVAALARTRTGVCMCPTTERDLADGVGPSVAFAHAGVRISLGSDSHAVIDVLEEARLVELHERLGGGRRGHHSPQYLLQSATAAGMEALGWPAGAIAPGMVADFVAIDPGSTRLAGISRRDALAALVFAAARDDVTHVVNSGRLVVEDRRHRLVDDVGGALRAAIAQVVGDDG